MLKLERGKWYVGRSTDPMNRFLAHFDAGGSAWTRKYAVVQVHEVRPMTSLLEEDHVTEEYMAEFGVENVRGGSYCQLELPAAVVDVLQRKLLHADNLCVRCGAADHYVADCPVCARCGRDSHTAERCYAKTHVNGGPPTEVREEKASKQRTRGRPEAAAPPTRKSPKQPKQAKQPKRTNRNVCGRCGR